MISIAGTSTAVDLILLQQYRVGVQVRVQVRKYTLLCLFKLCTAVKHAMKVYPCALDVVTVSYLVPQVQARGRVFRLAQVPQLMQNWGKPWRCCLRDDHRRTPRSTPAMSQLRPQREIDRVSTLHTICNTITIRSWQVVVTRTTEYSNVIPCEYDTKGMNITLK